MAPLIGSATERAGPIRVERATGLRGAEQTERLCAASKRGLIVIPQAIPNCH